MATSQALASTRLVSCAHAVAERTCEHRVRVEVQRGEAEVSSMMCRLSPQLPAAVQVAVHCTMLEYLNRVARGAHTPSSPWPGH
jgi:hypothetical protein